MQSTGYRKDINNVYVHRFVYTVINKFLSNVLFNRYKYFPLCYCTRTKRNQIKKPAFTTIVMTLLQTCFFPNVVHTIFHWKYPQWRQVNWKNDRNSRHNLYYDAKSVQINIDNDSSVHTIILSMLRTYHVTFEKLLF